MNWLVIGVDPGPTPGIVALYGFSIGPFTPRVVQCDWTSAMTIVRALRMSASTLDCRHILAVEKFVIGPRAARSRTPKAGEITRNLIEVLRDAAHPSGSEFVERPAGAVKPWATDARLAAAGLLDLTKGMTHSRDAARHALFAAVHAGLMPDPLSKKASQR